MGVCKLVSRYWIMKDLSILNRLSEGGESYGRQGLVEGNITGALSGWGIYLASIPS